MKEYEVQTQLKPSNLIGISDDQINDHWKLYEGYVSQVNKLLQDLSGLESGSLLYADRRRRLGFEFNGMVLHELYFSNLKAKVELPKETKFKKAIENQWKSFEKWLQDFKNCGKTRGIGWAILYFDTASKQFLNNFISEHENGHISSFIPILVMDVWEHAYMVDHKAGGRGIYIDNFVKNINWKIVEKRFEDAVENKIFKRF